MKLFVTDRYYISLKWVSETGFTCIPYISPDRAGQDRQVPRLMMSNLPTCAELEPLQVVDNLINFNSNFYFTKKKVGCLKRPKPIGVDTCECIQYKFPRLNNNLQD